MNDTTLNHALNVVNNQLNLIEANETKDNYSIDNKALCLLIKCSILKALKQRAEALNALSNLSSIENSITKTEYFIPFSRFELASLRMEEVAEKQKSSGIVDNTALDEVKAKLKTAESYRDSFHFKNRLHFRIHLASVELKLMKRNWAESSGNLNEISEAEDVQSPTINNTMDENFQNLTPEEQKQFQNELKKQQQQ